MKKIPIALIYSRIFIGIVILLLAFYKPTYYTPIIVSLVIIGLLTDVFDGIIARQLKISTTKMRRLDSNVDMVFWICVIAASYVLSPAFYRNNFVELTILISLELACYVLSYIKFKKEVATHALSAKVWALLIFATLIQVIATKTSGALFIACFYWGIISRLEIIAMLIVIKKWTNDIPTIYHAFKIRKGKKIKRLKLFNG
ncbi:MAG: CDP-alcohol phosphatidyltransferase family protein [Mucilaginibacter sp.]|uniref:CDP-alcohol phosphatidyltransferase family protein n=1 Tax=Mucilaginibacter sp. TaxID=1882438 RepID=UPI003265E125